MNSIKRLLLALGLPLLIGGFMFAPALTVHAANPADEVTKGVNATNTATDAEGGCKNSNDRPRKCELTDYIGIVVNVLLFIIGTVSVIMIIIGGIRYTTSNGDSNQVTAAKNTILYAVIGVIVSLLAFAITAFVVDQFSK